MKVWLFDVDGVLVRPRGYHAALIATVDHFARQMGLASAGLTDTAIETFEACGITSEWDSSAMCVGALWAHAWRDVSLQPHSLEAALNDAPRPGVLDYATLAQRVAANRFEGERAPVTALRLLRNDAANSLDSPLAEFLLHARDFHRSPTMRTFQIYALGSGKYAELYGEAPAFESESLLAALDRSFLTPASSDLIHREIAAGRLRAAVYTARPSLPPRGVTEIDGYSPEAEIAVGLTGLSDLPLVGYGHVSWLAAQREEHPDSYLKPSPVHALAAMGAAISGRETESLLAARELSVGGRITPPLAELAGQDVEVTVFEDSVGGIQAVRGAASLLKESGVKVDVVARAISAESEKRAALERAGGFAQVWGDVNQAIADS